MDEVKVLADNGDLLEFESTARRPYYRMRGKPVTKEQAFEIIRRTDDFFIYDCFLFNGDRIDSINFNNWLISKNHIPQGHGWIHADGTVGCNSITQKYPTAEEFIKEWSGLIQEFPYLDLVIAITGWDESYHPKDYREGGWDDIRFDYEVFGIYNDFQKEDYDDEFYDDIEIGIYVHDNTVELMSPERTREKYREYAALYEDKNRDKYVADYYEDNGIVQVDETYLRRLITSSGADPDTILSKIDEYKWNGREEKRPEKNKIIVRTQEELDAVDEEFDGIIELEFGADHNLAEVKNNYKAEIHVGGGYQIGVWGKNRVTASDDSFVAVHNEARVTAFDKTWVYADDNAFVNANGQVYIQARDNSTAVARGSGSIFAMGNAKIRAYGSTTIYALDNVNIRAFDDCCIGCRQNVTVEAGGRCVVRAANQCSIKALYRCTVIASDECAMKAYGDSVIIAGGVSTVTAYRRSTVYASGSACVLDMQQGGKITTTGWASVRHKPKTPAEFCECNGLRHDEGKGRFYIPVIKRDGRFLKDNYSKTVFEPGKITAVEGYDADYIANYSFQVHTLEEALAECISVSRHRSNDYDAVLEIEAELKDIEFSKYGDDYVSVKAARVIREVPFSECGQGGSAVEMSKSRMTGFKFGDELIDGVWHYMA